MTFKIVKQCDNCKYARFISDNKAKCEKSFFKDLVMYYNTCRKWKHREQRGDMRL